jgi:ArsR family transcriptional regulator
LNHIDKICKALGDRNRLRITASLFLSKELCACQIHEWLGVSGATASNHLSILANAGLIRSRKDGKWVHYRLNRTDPEIQSLLRWVKKNISNDLELNLELDQLKLVTDCSPIELRIRQRKEKSKTLCC